MASIVRLPMLRQRCLLAPAKRQLSTKTAANLRPSPSEFLQQRKRPFQLPLAKSGFQGKSGVAAFHASGRKAILPAEPQHIEGTVNDAAPIPETSPTHGSYHWTFERLISATLIPLTIAPFAAGTHYPIVDALLCSTLLIHSHIGFQALIIDYLPSKRVPKTRAVFHWGLRAATLVVAVGLYEFETNDVGLTEGIRRVWTA